MCTSSPVTSTNAAHVILRRSFTRIALVVLAAVLASPVRMSHATTTITRVADSPLRLARVFGEGVVLQRGVAVPVWGTSAAGARIQLTFRGQTLRTTADGSGSWNALLAPLAAGGPFTMVVKSGSDSLALREVYVGDVWVASGQSNMEWKLSDAMNGPRDAAVSRDHMLREFKVPISWSWKAEDDVAGGSWSPADSAHAGNFSAVAFYFARELRKTAGVPIGILNATWGGSSLAPWLSRRALGLTDGAWQAVRNTEERFQSSLRDSLRARLGDLPSVDSGLVDGRAVWAEPSFDDARWANIAVPSAWERVGYAGMDGIAWYRSSFDLSASDAQQSVRISLATIDDADIVWLNGVQIGSTNSYSARRIYSVPSNVLRAGRNVLTVRVVDGGGDGGIIGAPDQVYAEIAGEKRRLAATWKFKIATVATSEDGQHTNKIPGILYNRMVHPLLKFPIKGVIWYQGESNANNDEQARAYANEFKTLISSWRGEWSSTQPNFPFLWVQLPNYGTPEVVPPSSGGWALLRESQAQALTLPNTGQAIAIDIGDAAELHPRNKLDVGRRLALLAQSVAYKQPVVAQGPTYKAHVVRGTRIEVQFDHIGRGLTAHSTGAGADSTKVDGFAIAGRDGKFAWADARIVGNVVHVSSEQVRAPVSVRYAWGNSPARATLYNRNGLPAAPFRTDSSPHWVGTWQAAPQLVEERNLPPAPGLSGSTLRQMIHVSVGGSRVRLRFANLFGNGPIQLSGVQIALSAGGSAIVATSSKTLTFNGTPSVTIKAGTVVESDATDFAVGPLADVTITMLIAQAPSDVTGHPGSRTTTYLQSGDHLADGSMPDAVKTEHWYVLSGLDVIAGNTTSAVAIIGNSITDGRGSGTDKNNRWPDELSRRLRANPATTNVAVLNAGIGGNAVVRGGLGPTALSRVTRDVYQQSGARWAVVFEGVNDIGGARGAEGSAAVARDLIAAYQQFVVDAHLRGLKIYGATILPFGGSQYDSPEHEAARQTVNAWIRSSGAFDAVIDFDAALRDPVNPARLRPDTDSGDHLHPSEAGHHAMAEAVDLMLFRLSSPRR